MEYDQRKQSLLSEVESEKVQIYFACRHLNIDSASLVVYQQQTNKPRKLVLKTKPAKNTFNPEFAETLVTEYYFQDQVRQKLIIELTSNNILGVAQASIGQIFSGRGKGIVKPIMDAKRQEIGQIWLRCEKVQRGNSKYVQFSPNGTNIDVGSYFLCFGQASSFLRMYKIKNGQEYLLHESQVLNGRNPHFKAIKISEKRLCNCDSSQPIVIRFYQEGMAATLIGQTQFTLQMLSQGTLRFVLAKHGKQKGNLILSNFQRTVKYEFMDFLSSGMQMAMIICIDFTASNQIQTAPASLHYHTQNKNSQYEQALHEVANIVLDYDNDKLVPTFGFGAKVNLPNFNTGGKVHHCFPLNGSDSNPNLFNLNGIMEGYRKCLPYLTFGGPTYFAPLLREAMSVCENMRKQIKEYMILMIMTDGQIHDIEEVKDLLVKCGRLPLSIIIVGIGNNNDGNWGLMNELDDDNCQMRDKNGNKTQRDLVQFVEFVKHNNNGVALARQVLEELPRQVQEYHRLVNIAPNDYLKNNLNDANMYRN